MDGLVALFGREPGQIVIRVEADVARHARSDDEIMRVPGDVDYPDDDLALAPAEEGDKAVRQDSRPYPPSRD